MHLKSRLSVAVAGVALLASAVVVPALAQTPPNSDSTLTPRSEAPRVPLRATVVGRELVYPNGVMVSLDKGTGLRPEAVTSLSSGKINWASVPRATVIPCSADYTCLYEHRGYGGRRLQWRDRNQLIDLTTYEFNDKMSSWVNNNDVDARWYYDAGGRNEPYRCMNANTNNSYVGDTDNDKASSLRIYGSSTACN
jgi:hypothetical protein